MPTFCREVCLHLSVLGPWGGGGTGQSSPKKGWAAVWTPWGRYVCDRAQAR